MIHPQFSSVPPEVVCLFLCMWHPFLDLIPRSVLYFGLLLRPFYSTSFYFFVSQVAISHLPKGVGSPRAILWHPIGCRPFWWKNGAWNWFCSCLCEGKWKHYGNNAQIQNNLHTFSRDSLECAPLHWMLVSIVWSIYRMTSCVWPGLPTLWYTEAS